MGRPANCNCNCSDPPLNVDAIRGIRCLGPVTGDTSVSGHTVDWRWDRIVAEEYGNGAGATGGPNLGGRSWTYFPDTFPLTTLKMRAIRFGATISTDYYGVGALGPSKRQASGNTPPATSDGHFSGSVISGINIQRGLISAMSGNAGSRIVAGRVWIDGVDVTGVVTLSVGFTVSNVATYPFGRFWSNAFTIAVPTTTVSSAKSIWFDLWIESRNTFGANIKSSEVINIQPFPAAYGPVISATGSFSPYAGTGYGPVMTSGQINVHRRLRLSDTWTLSFTGGTVGGASSLVMQAQTGWSYLRQGPLVTMTKTSGTGAGDAVWLRYDTETPEIIIKLQSMLTAEQNGAGGQNTGRMRYSVLSPSYYSPALVSGNAIGPVTASTANTFVPTARGYYGPFNLWQPIEQTFPAQRTGFPTSISASR